MGNSPIGDPVKPWLERWKGTSVWTILALVHKAWDYLRGFGIAPSDDGKPGGDGGLQGPR